MNILLVQPKSSGYMGQISRSGIAGFARVSLTTIAALTPPEHTITLHDARRSDPDYDGNWDVIGFTGMTTEIPHVYQMADQFRQRGRTVIIGGYHASALPEEALEHADAVVVGEAEKLWPQILAEIAQGGLTRRVYQNAEQIEMRDMAIPRRELLDRNKYSIYATLQATRGCPFNCDFCTVTRFFGHSFRARPVSEVVAEIASLPEEKRWMFLDDNLVGDRQYAKELFRALIPLRIYWGAQGSIDIARDPELMDLYAAAGGRYLFIGFESISPDTLKEIHKGWNRPDTYPHAVREVHRRGITIMGSFIFGLDHDDITVFKRTVDFVNTTKIDVAIYNLLTPFPGTVMYDRFNAEQRIHDRNWAHYDVCHAVIHPARMTAEELQHGWYWATRETYRWPNILKRILRTDPGWTHRLIANYAYARKSYRCPPPVDPERFSHPVPRTSLLSPDERQVA